MQIEKILVYGLIIKKIAAIGIRVSRWVAYHGFSINVNNNLEDYKKIIPCGLDNNKITSIKNEGK